VANGQIRLDPDYAHLDHPTRKWVDQPEHDALHFQYDPAEIKWDYQSGWKAGDDKSVGDDFNVPWDFGEKERLRELRVVLHFNDYSAVGAKNSTRQAIDTLEAYAKPILQPHLQPLRLEYERTVTLLKLKQRMIVEEKSHRQVTGDVDSSVEATAWRILITQRYDKKITFTQKTARPAIGLLRDVDAWHTPRPLLLRLFTNEEWKCLLKDMEVDYIRFDLKTGVPTIAAVKLVLIERFGLKVNGLGMVLPTATELAQIPDISTFSKFVHSGAIQLTAPPPMWQAPHEVTYKLGENQQARKVQVTETGDIVPVEE
jgi:hypothetical protein